MAGGAPALHWRGFAPPVTPSGLIWERRNVARFSWTATAEAMVALYHKAASEASG